MIERDFESALERLRHADTYSRMSGNRFFEGIFLPAHAASAIMLNLSHLPEVKRTMRRAKARAGLGRSFFYDAQIDATKATIAYKTGYIGHAERLAARAQRHELGVLRFYPLEFL